MLLYVPGVSHVASSTWHALSSSSPLGENPDKIKHPQKVIDYSYFLLIHHCIFTVLTKKLITFFLPYLFMNCKRTEIVSYLCPCPQALAWHCACMQPGLCVLSEWMYAWWNTDWRPKLFYKFAKESVISPADNKMKLCHTMGRGGMLTWKMYFRTFTLNPLRVQVLPSCNLSGCWDPSGKTLCGRYSGATSTGRIALG